MVGRRRASFSVRTPRGGAPQVLSALASLLEAQGGAVAVDRQGFTLRAQMPAQAAAPADACSGLDGSMQATEGNGEAGEGRGTCHAVCKHQKTSMGDVDEDGLSTSTARKRQKKSAVSSSSRGESEVGQEVGAYVLQVRLMQESKSTCVVTASVATSVSDEVTGSFTLLCKVLESDIALMLGS